MQSERLRYTGELPTTFLTGNVGYTEPGGEFDVPGGLLVGFMRRADVEHAVECPAPPCRCGEEPRPGPGPEDDSGGGQEEPGQAPPGQDAGGQEEPAEPAADAAVPGVPAFTPPPPLSVPQPPQ